MQKKNKKNILLIFILILGGFLLFYRINDLMPFIGDQGWFYLSARDMIKTGQVPLVGITSSHTWLHQGPFWTYLLAGALWIGNFNPVAGGYLTAITGLITIWLVFKIGSEMFSKRVGLMASLIYATMPLVVFFARMPYHTEPIAPLTLLLFYALYKWINGAEYAFVFIMLLFALLYNFELATIMLSPIFLCVLGYGIFKKMPWVKNIFQKKIILLSLFAFFIPMIPMILYDIGHGYPQTLKFTVWIGYKIATVFGFPKIHPALQGETFQTMLPFASVLVKRMVFYQNSFMSWLILGASLINLFILNKTLFQQKKYLHTYSLLLLFFLVPAIIYIAQKTNSDAYWVVFFPTVSFMLALLFDRLLSFKKLFYLGAGILLLFVFYNVFSLLKSNFLMGHDGYGLTLKERIDAASKIVKEADQKEYNIKAKGSGSQYESFVMNYEYLTWWFGHGPSQAKQKLRFVISETPKGVVVERQLNSKN